MISFQTSSGNSMNYDSPQFLPILSFYTLNSKFLISVLSGILLMSFTFISHFSSQISPSSIYFSPLFPFFPTSFVPPRKFFFIDLVIFSRFTLRFTFQYPAFELFPFFGTRFLHHHCWHRKDISQWLGSSFLWSLCLLCYSVFVSLHPECFWRPKYLYLYRIGDFWSNWAFGISLVTWIAKKQTELTRNLSFIFTSV